MHIEVRKKIVEARSKGIRVTDICNTYSVGKSAVYDLLKQEAETGDITPLTHQRGRKPLLTEANLSAIEHLIQVQNDITLEEIKEELGLCVSISTISWDIRHRLGYRYKKRQYTPVNETGRM